MMFDEASTLLHIHTISSNNYQIARKGPTWLLQTAVSHCKKNPREADCPLACSNFMIGSDLIQVQSLQVSSECEYEKLSNIAYRSGYINYLL